MKWEYKSILFLELRTQINAKTWMEMNSNLEKLLNQYGNEGWEIAKSLENIQGSIEFLIFKRPVK